MIKRYINRYNFILLLVIVIVLKLCINITSFFLEERSENYSAYAEYKHSINEGYAQQVHAKHLYYLNEEQ